MGESQCGAERLDEGRNECAPPGPRAGPPDPAVPLSALALGRLRASGCTGKTGYNSRREAKRRARRLLVLGFGRQKCYECPFCGLWHNSERTGGGDYTFFAALHDQIVNTLAGTSLAAIEPESDRGETA